ncbi:MAG TPA: hypothetical protein VLC71_05005 [Thermomonas sp.]|nr:hypothetical protein [Thermomonas sp.]
MKLAGSLFAMLITLNSYAAEPHRACVPSARLAIGGISLSDSRATVLGKLGKPKATGSYQGEDDGGSYTGATLTYSQVELEIDQLRGIERISSIGPGAMLPLGLKVGLSLEKTGELLHFIPGSLEKGMVVLPVCGGYRDIELRLHFESDKLTVVEIAEHGP